MEYLDKIILEVGSKKRCEGIPREFKEYRKKYISREKS